MLFCEKEFDYHANPPFSGLQGIILWDEQEIFSLSRQIPHCSGKTAANPYDTDGYGSIPVILSAGACIFAAGGLGISNLWILWYNRFFANRNTYVVALKNAGRKYGIFG